MWCEWDSRSPGSEGLQRNNIEKEVEEKGPENLDASEILGGELLETATSPVPQLFKENKIISENPVAKLLRSISCLRVT